MKKLLLTILSIFCIASSAQAADPENTLLLQLKDGTVEIELWPSKAPKTVAQVEALARKGFYNGTPFHRVIDGFMAQGGDPTGTGAGGSGTKVPDEFPAPSQPYSRGIVAMANAGPGTTDSQFFIMLKDYPLPPQYTIIGKVTKGMEFVDKIKKGDSNDNGKVSDPDKIISLKVAADKK